MEAKKQKKIQRRLDKESKKQIKKFQKDLYNQDMKRSNSFNPTTMRKINYVTRSRSDNKTYKQSWEDTFPKETFPQIISTKRSSSSSSDGILEKSKASFSRDDVVMAARTAPVISSNEGDLEKRNYEDCIVKPALSYESASSRDTAAMQGTISRGQGISVLGAVSDLGNVFECRALAEDIRYLRMVEDIRDLRMVDSDFSSSGDEDDSSASSLRYHYSPRSRR